MQWLLIGFEAIMDIFFFSANQTYYFTIYEYNCPWFLIKIALFYTVWFTKSISLFMVDIKPRVKFVLFYYYFIISPSVISSSFFWLVNFTNLYVCLFQQLFIIFFLPPTNLQILHINTCICKYKIVLFNVFHKTPPKEHIIACR